MRKAAVAAAAVAALLALQAHAASQTLKVTVGTSTEEDPPIIGGGGGGGGGSSVRADTGVTVSGRAYPMSRVFVLRDGTRVASTIAGPDARFSASLTRISAGTHTISVFGEDEAGRRSTLFSFPIMVTSGAMTTVSGIYLAPTIDTDKSEVRYGDPITIFGKASPSSNVTLEINSSHRIFESAPSDADGVYLYQLASTRLERGSHTAASRAAIAAEISPQSQQVGFVVGDENVLRDTDLPESGGCAARRGDVDCNARVNLVDYSIMAYWYGRAESVPQSVDLNGDGRVTLVDLSILAYYWTG